MDKLVKYCIGLTLICLFFLFTNCKEEKEVKPVDVSYTYLLVDLEALLPLDLNFDGIENVDLSKEIDVIQYNNPLSCSISFSTRNDTLTIAWAEPQEYRDPFLTPELMYAYTGENIKYSIVSRHYTYWINHDGSIIYLKEIEEEAHRSFYRLEMLTALIVDKEQNIIKFGTPFSSASQNFLTRDGIKTRSLSAVFKPYPDDN